jgi:hypothetical protein
MNYIVKASQLDKPWIIQYQKQKMIFQC